MTNIRKTSTSLLDDHYNTPTTSLLTFHFEPHAHSHERLHNSHIQHHSLDGKDVYLIDNFFSPTEAEELRTYSAQATFSRNSYGSPEAIAQGEQPARSMNGKERWLFFSQPPQPIHALYHLFSTFAHHLDAAVSTLPWELCDAHGNGSPSVIGNLLHTASPESMDLGKHKDADPASNISFAIPLLYPHSHPHHTAPFPNGAPGKPWLISIMLYATDAAFLPHYRMGTAFYDQREQLALRADCLHTRLVLFEGDIVHSIEASEIPPSVSTWRVSYVFKLLLNPKHPTQSLKTLLHTLLTHE